MFSSLPFVYHTFHSLIIIYVDSTVLCHFIIMQGSGTVELPALVSNSSNRGTSASPKPLPKAPGSKSSSPSPSTGVKNASATTSSSSVTTAASSATQDLLGLGEHRHDCFSIHDHIPEGLHDPLLTAFPSDSFIIVKIPYHCNSLIQGLPAHRHTC